MLNKHAVKVIASNETGELEWAQWLRKEANICESLSDVESLAYLDSTVKADKVPNLFIRQDALPADEPAAL
jgi:ABC-type Zn uptake system ZnuABC Zn-binding protein ZnuA